MFSPTECITLIASNGDKFSVPWSVAKQSKLIRNMCEEGLRDTENPDDQDLDDQELSFPSIDSPTLGLVIKLMQGLVQKKTHMRERLAQLPKDSIGRVIDALYHFDVCERVSL